MSLGVGDKEEGNPPAVKDVLRHYLWCNMVTHIQPLADGKYRIVTQFGNRDYFLFAARPEAEDGVNVSKRITIWTIEYVSERGSYMIHRDAGGVLQATNAGTVMTNRNHFHAFELHRYWAIIGNPSDGYVMTPLSSPTSGAMVCPTPKLGAELPVKLGGIVPGAVGSQQLWKFELV